MSRGLGDVYKRQAAGFAFAKEMKLFISKLFPYSLANSKFANIGRTAPKIDRKR